MSAATDRLVNLRDLGDLPLVSGGRTRPGVLYRGDAPFPGDSSPAGVALWPPATVIDLRSPAEREANRHRWGPSTVVHPLPLHAAAAPSEQPRISLGALYELILRTAGHRLARVVEVVATAPGPVFMHCVAGKDRTGIAVAALLLAADVEPAAVAADYLATGANVDALRRRWSEKGCRTGRRRPIPEEWLVAPSEAIEVVVDRLTTWPTGAAGWLTDHGADDEHIQAWRDRISDPGSSIPAAACPSTCATDGGSDANQGP